MCRKYGDEKSRKYILDSAVYYKRGKKATRKKGTAMNDNKTYIIHKDEWNYDGLYPRFIDDTSGIIVDLVLDGDNKVKLLGSSTSYVDDGNVYYYDLTSNVFANRAWNNSFGYIDDVFNKDGKVIVDIEVPEWFIDHAQKLVDIDDEYQDIFIDAFENYNGDSTIGDIRETLYKYLVDNNIDSNEYVIDDIIGIAENTGMMWYDYARNQYNINI